MLVGVAYADKFKQTWLKLDVPEGSTVREAIERSGLLERFPEIDLSANKVGIFGKLSRLDATLNDGELLLDDERALIRARVRAGFEPDRSEL